MLISGQLASGIKYLNENFLGSGEMSGASTTDLQLFELPGRGSAAPELLGRCSAPDLQLAELPGRVSTADLILSNFKIIIFLSFTNKIINSYIKIF